MTRPVARTLTRGGRWPGRHNTNSTISTKDRPNSAMIIYKNKNEIDRKLFTTYSAGDTIGFRYGFVYSLSTTALIGILLVIHGIIAYDVLVSKSIGREPTLTVISNVSLCNVCPISGQVVNHFITSRT